MIKKNFLSIVCFIRIRVKDFKEFWTFLVTYFSKKIRKASGFFELNKNFIVKFFMMKRGRYSRPFLHIATLSILTIGVLIAPHLASTYPVFSAQQDVASEISSPTAQQSIVVGEDVFKTDVSQKPRDEIVNYTVAKGDTISTIAKKFGISEETIKWENNLRNDSITVGDTLKILPVTGMSHKVARGDTVYSIAKKYDTNAQQIVNFPFNDFANPETFSLVAGQILIVPEGIKPAAQPTYIRRQTFVARGPVSASSAGFTWPLGGGISQFSTWYHTAIDITNKVGTPVVAAQNGVVIKALSGAWDGGYGTNVAISDGAGNSSLYAHLSGLNVSVGDEVVAGRTVIGWIGMTGRTTGAHLHFEIRRGGVLVNPLAYLP